MIYFKHPISAEVFAYDTQAERERYGAAELVLMSDSEVNAHLNPPTVLPTATQQIEALERETLLPRPVRDFMLISMEQAAAEQGASQGLTPTQSIAILRANNSGYRKVKELDEQIAALRALL